VLFRSAFDTLPFGTAINLSSYQTMTL